MLSEERIKKMIRLSDYEAGRGDIDLRRTRFSKRDYVRLMALRTAAGLIAASVLIIGMVFLYYINSISWKEYVSDGFFTIRRILLIAGGFLAWLIVLGIFLGVSARRGERDYEESELRVKEYEQTLDELMKLYEDEGREDGL